MSGHGEAVYATLLMSDNYLPGAMVLAHSLKDNGTKAKLVALVTLDTVSGSTIDELKTVYDDVTPIPRIVNKTPANLFLMERPDLVSTFSKIELWKQTQYSQIVYIDSDIVALRAPDELLTRDTHFAAVPDIGWPDCFNSGLMVLRPNMGDYYSLLALAQRGISFDGADQGLLNMHFRNWDRLSFTYNCTPSGNYQYVPAYRHFQSSINMVHFIGNEKPWFQGREASHGAGVYSELLGRWWATYDRHYRAPVSQPAPGYSNYSSAVLHPDVTKHVKGEYTAPPTITFGYSSSSAPSPQVPQQSSSASSSTFAPAASAPTPTRAQPPVPESKPFSPPLAEWNAAQAPPPTNSKPEAPNFPNKQYTMSKDTKLFQPPASYPEAPKNMWYEVPPKSPVKPKADPVFPWENKAPKATRVFPEAPEPLPIPDIPAMTSAKKSAPSPFTPSVSITGSDPWDSYSRQNAWDEVPEIQRYMAAVQRSRNRRSVQLVPQQSDEEVLSPGAEAPPAIKTERRPSMKLTDFPSTSERPSLPVTPAAIRRPTFWGGEEDDFGKGKRGSISDLPPAEGVPSQAEWNPSVKLDELQRRQSAVLLERLAGLDQTAESPVSGSPGSTATGVNHNSSSNMKHQWPEDVVDGKPIPERVLPGEEKAS